MQLPTAEAERFYRLYHSLLAFANCELGIAPDLEAAADIRASPVNVVAHIRDGLYEHHDLIPAFVRHRSAELGGADAALVSSWADFRAGTFLVYRYLKKHAIFLEPDECLAFGVLALHDPLEHVLGSRLPVMVRAVLLPFEGRIVYDGLLASYAVTFGGGLRSRLADEYAIARADPGVITSLPVDEQVGSRSKADLLREYLRSARSRELFADEIEALASSSAELAEIYHLEMGRLHARQLGKRLKELGVMRGWFAVLDDVVVGSGATKAKADRAAREVLPPRRHGHVHLFQIRGLKGKGKARSRR